MPAVARSGTPAVQPAVIEAAVAAMRSGIPASAELVDLYYTLCIPFYREFLGEHWHTGFYDPVGPIGTGDQLRMERVVAASAGLAAGMQVLDVGCGIGGPACHLARVTGVQVRGLTPNEAQLDIARACAERQRLGDRVIFDRGFADALPYPDASFDAVLFFESACHFPDRPAFFAEALRVLRAGGRLAGQDWVASDRAPEPLRQAWSRRVESTWAIPALGTVSGYAAQMAAAGFEVREAVDMRDEMALLRGFIANEADRAEVASEMRATVDPVRRLIIEGLLVLGEAAASGAFSIGRFVAVKPG
jgi:ubiquinone/menaquinone biosynthesis C-methylase UbiE